LILHSCVPQFSRSWFKPEEASGLRQRIRELLLEEFESSRLDQCCRISVAESSERIKGIDVAESDEATGEAIGSTPIPDAVSDSGVKRSEGNEEVTGSSMPIAQYRMQFVRSLGPRCGSQEFTDEQVEQRWNLAIGVGAAADPAGMRAGNS
jgi:hypothetical protein